MYVHKNEIIHNYPVFQEYSVMKHTWIFFTYLYFFVLNLCGYHRQQGMKKKTATSILWDMFSIPLLDNPAHYAVLYPNLKKII